MLQITEESIYRIEEAAAEAATAAHGALDFMHDAVEHFGTDARYHAICALLAHIEREAARAADLCDEATTIAPASQPDAAV